MSKEKSSPPSTPLEEQKRQKVISPFLTFMTMFIGAGFISGGIVHIGEGFNWWDASLIGIGVILFVLGSYSKEFKPNKASLTSKGVLNFLFASLFLSIGIGMASGGIQHFLDTPDYSVYLIPTGLLIGLIAFVFKENIQLGFKDFFKLLTGTAIVAAILGLGLNASTKFLPEAWLTSSHDHEHGSEHQETKPSSASHEHSVAIKSDEDFLTHMIPHHQEAVDTSAYLLTRTDHPELKAFLKNVIEIQAEEIDLMKEWHQTWLGRPYVDSKNYVPMMGNLNELSAEALEKAYLQGMILHHEMAVETSKDILNQTSRPELKTLAENIISTQQEEVKLMNAWLSKHTSKNTPPSPSEPHSDETSEIHHSH